MAKPLPPLAALPRDLVALGDYEARAPLHLDGNAWAYLNGAAGDEISRRWNRNAYEELAILPRVLRSMAGGNTRIELLGRTHESPFLLAPVAWQGLFHPEGELASACAAAALGTGMVLSTLSSHTLEEVAQAFAQLGGGPLWFQLYWQPERDINRDLLQRAVAAGFEAIVLTVDAPINGIRNAEQRAGFHLPPGVLSANLVPYTQSAVHRQQEGHPLFDQLMGSAPGWEDLAWLVAESPLPVIVKGILHPQDAVQAADLGAAAVVVSNHGGRTLDTLPATLTVLSGVVQALQGRIPVLVDGGIRRGSDIFKALALGARAVLVGRGYVQGLAVAGALGVAHVIRLLRDELAATMALAGCATVAAINADYLCPGNPYSTRSR